MKDHLPAMIFLRELYPNKMEVLRVLIDETIDLKEEVQKFLHDNSGERWLELHTMDFSVGVDDGKELNVVMVAVGEIDYQIEQMERSIADMELPASMGEYDTAAFTDRYRDEKRFSRSHIRALNTGWSKNRLVKNTFSSRPMCSICCVNLMATNRLTSYRMAITRNLPPSELRGKTCNSY